MINGDEISVSASDERSYCCAVLRTGGVSSTIGITGFLNFSAIVPVARGRELPNILNAENRYCWIDGVGTPLYTAARRLVLGNITTSADALPWCDDTTLVGNYNTSVSEFNFLEVTVRTGNTSSTVNLKIRFKSAITGNEVVIDLAVTLNSATGDTQRMDLPIHDLLAGATDFGDIKISHDGAPGQVSARVSQYDVTSTNPLDLRL